jgi:uncharacterized membrane protein
MRKPYLALLALPGFFFTLMTTEYKPTIQISFQYTTHWIPYLFGGTVIALHLLSRREHGVVLRRAALGALCFTLLSHSYIFGAILQRDTFVGGFARIQFAMTEREKERHAELMSMVALIPPDASVAATDNDVPHMSARRTVFTLRMHHGDADYLLINRQSTNFGRTRENIRKAFDTNNYGLVARGPKWYFLFKRGYTSPETEAARAAIGFPIKK